MKMARNDLCIWTQQYICSSEKNQKWKKSSQRKWFLLKIYFLVGQQIGDLGTPPPLDISFPPLSLNMNSLKQILEDVKIEGGSEKRENCLLGARLVSNPYVTSQKRIKRVSTLESQLKKSSVAFHSQLWKNNV